MTKIEDLKTTSRISDYVSRQGDGKFYAGYAKKGDDGFYHVIPCVEPERWGITYQFQRNKDITASLCMFRWALNRAADGAEVLGVDADLRKQWREVAAGIAEVSARINSSRLRIRSASLNFLSYPIVLDLFAAIARPQRDPLPWAGYTSHSSGSARILVWRLSKRRDASSSALPGNRSGRPTSPTKRVSPEKMATGVSPREMSVAM